MKLLKQKNTNKNTQQINYITGTNKAPLIELRSNREAVIEGAAGIVEYNDTQAVINCKSFLLTFSGFGISLSYLSSDSIKVTGNFSGISFSAL